MPGIIDANEGYVVMGGAPGLCKRYAKKKGIAPETVNGRVVFDAVERYESEAVEALDAYTAEIAVQIFNLQTLLDPDRFAIGGGISAQPVFLEYLRKNSRELISKSYYHVRAPEIVCCKFQNDANLYGAYESFAAEFLM